MGKVFRRVTTVILFLILAVNLAFPIDVLGYLAASHYPLHIMLSSRSVLIEEQLGGSCLTHSFEHLTKGVAAIEEQQQYGYVSLSGILHKQ